MSGDVSQRVGDQRVTRVIAWVWGVLGLLVVSVIGIAANNLYQLNITVARSADTSASMATTLADHEARLRQVERDLSTVEGKVFRGVDGYQQEDAKRGK